jgi:hypothetical protein
MDLFKQIAGRPHVLIGSEYVPIVDVLAMLDRLAEDGWQARAGDPRGTLRGINRAMVRQATGKLPQGET